MEDLTRRSFTLEITTAVRALDGRPLSAPFAQPFPFDSGEPAPGDGTGFVSGEIYDASTGRSLAGARVAVLPSTMNPVLADHRGRYTVRLPEGVHTLHVAAPGYTEVWRQLVVRAGAGVAPIDIRLAHRAGPATVAALPLALTDGGDAVAARATLEIPAGGVQTGSTIAFTSVGAQSLAGLLPIGWSPLASAEIALEGGELAAAALSFDVPSTRLAASGKWLSLVRYDAARDEWRVITPVVSIDGNRARAQIASAGAYALVYGDATARAPAPGGVLSALPDRCAVTPCAFATSSLTLDPARVLPNETTVATLVIDGRESPFPSGTAVQAWIDEELTLADGTLLLDPPFAADLILYRTLEGTDATAVFHLAPSRRAAEVILESGVDHVRLRPYPGRLARGTLVGPEGGRIPSDENVSVEIPAGATADPVRASASSLGADELASLGVVAGFRILGGLALSLERVDGASADADGDGDPDPAVPVMLGASARLTFRADASLLAPDAQVIVVEVVGDTPYGRVMRVAARTAAVPLETAAARLFTTSPIDRSVLPLDGIVREGRYLFLAAEAPIAFATGSIRRGTSGPYLENALVSAPPLGVRDLTRTGGLFVVPVPAAPAQPFSVVARHAAIGEGMPRVAESAPAKDAVVALGDLLLEAQPPQVSSTVPSNGAKDVSLTSTVRVQFDRALDPESIRSDAIVVSGPAGILAGSVTSEGPSAILWSLAPGASLVPGAIYTARVSPQIRSIAGAPLAAPFSFSFAALSELSNGEVRSGLISITIPSPSGASSVQGAPGALPSGWRAVVVRRGNDFATRYQATASPNGEFILVAGGCESAPATCPDAIAITDLIDLHVTNAAGSLAAIIPLAPFVS
ncbi:MAG TPA: Ig-like domain-containing protein, partial [Thermoanaerobaculia bacterium]